MTVGPRPTGLRWGIFLHEMTADVALVGPVVRSWRSK